MPAAIVTALRAARRRRVAVDLDGQPWRALPLEAVVRAGLAVGCELDRSRARALGRELRRLRALEAATGALRHRDLSRRDVEARLERRGVPAAARANALAALSSAGLVDDERYARARAEHLARRGYGDGYIQHDLASKGVSSELAAAAIGVLEPEPQRAARLGPGRDAQATIRRLSRRGFAPESLERLSAQGPWTEIG